MEELILGFFCPIYNLKIDLENSSSGYNIKLFSFLFNQQTYLLEVSSIVWFDDGPSTTPSMTGTLYHTLNDWHPLPHPP